jgi:type II secretory pathway pseudopilin PulG
MCATAKSKPNRPGRLLALDWHDSAWRPRIVAADPAASLCRRPARSLPVPASAAQPPRHDLSFLKTMKTTTPHPRRYASFTIVELLTVISIIAILAAMLLPALSAAKIHAQKTQARLQISGIVTAIQNYDSAYSRFPVSSGVQSIAGGGEFTYGGALFAPWTPLISANYLTNNSEVIAILMDITNYPDGSGPTANNGHVKNPQQTVFLSANMVSDTNLPGVGPDLVYRDPWKNPYVITMDLDEDNQCEDAVYSLSAVSGGGLNGLIQQSGGYVYHGNVMVWSAGPDKQIDPTKAANTGVNKDNILSWQ